MHVEVYREAETPNSTLSRVTCGAAFSGYGLEDGFRRVKVAEETRIAGGAYRVDLRTKGAMHEKYRRRFSSFHEGMLRIRKVPGFTFIYFHIGNTVDDSAGCILLGEEYVLVDGVHELRNSRSAYEKFYQAVVPAARAGALRVSIHNIPRG